MTRIYMREWAVRGRSHAIIRSNALIVLVACWTHRDTPQWNFNRSSYISNQENAFENVVWKMAANLSRPQWFKRKIYMNNNQMPRMPCWKIKGVILSVKCYLQISGQRNRLDIRRPWWQKQVSQAGIFNIWISNWIPQNTLAVFEIAWWTGARDQQKQCRSSKTPVYAGPKDQQ